MPRAFDITAVMDSVRLDASGQGEVAFTVSNALHAPVRARASVVPAAGAKAEWFSITGLAERDFPPDGTHQLSVRVHVPPGTPPGRLTFHLLVVDVTNPDEHYAEGPSTAFEVAVAPLPPKPFPWLWVALGAGVILIVGTVIGIISSRGDEEVVPKLGQRCPQGECDRGLECTAADGGVCLVAQGQSCDGGAQCRTGFCDKQGRCELALGQTCESDATCPGPLNCVPVLGSQLCLLKPGEACESDRDCSSFFCTREGRCNRDDGRCETGEQCRAPSQCGPTKLCQLPDGEQCSGNEVCLSGFCSTTCQAAPTPPQCPPCPEFTVCRLGRCVFVRDHRINQDVLMGSSRTLRGIQQLQQQQQQQ